MNIGVTQIRGTLFVVFMGESTLLYLCQVLLSTPDKADACANESNFIKWPALKAFIICNKQSKHFCFSL